MVRVKVLGLILLMSYSWDVRTSLCTSAFYHHHEQEGIIKNSNKIYMNNSRITGCSLWV